MKKASKLILAAVLFAAFSLGLYAGGAPETKGAGPKAEARLDWPRKAIQIIAGGSPGGDTDFNGRAIGEFLGRELGQSVVIVNVPSGGGSVAARQVHDAAPDGYTLLIAHTSLLINKATGMIEYGLDGYELIGVLSESAGDIICVNAKSSPYKSLKDIVEAARKEPNKLRMAVNVGSTTQVISSMLEDKAGIQFNSVHGGGAAEKAVALLGGKIDVTILPYGTAKSYIESGDFLALAVVRSERNKKFPNIPCTVELGYDVVSPTRYFLAVTKGTPKEIVAKLREVTRKIVTENKEYAQMIDKAFSQDPTWMDVEKGTAEFARMQEVVNKYAKR
jgi:tripartite-type tricarboxylate transporter receptor subunit TctC